MLLQHMQLRNNTCYPELKSILHSVIQGTKAKFGGDNDHFLYFYSIVKK